MVVGVVIAPGEFDRVAGLGLGLVRPVEAEQDLGGDGGGQSGARAFVGPRVVRLDLGEDP